MTTKELAKEYQDMADKSSHQNGLWKGTYQWTARILRTYHRSRAKAMLRRLSVKYKSMACSCVFAGAANQLEAE